MSYYRDQLEAYLKTLDVKADYVIDWGGGQKPVEGRTKSWDVVVYKIFDQEKDLNQWQNVRNIADLIFCLETIEYCYDLYGAFENLHAALKDGGKLIISVPLIYPAHQEVELDSSRLTETGIRRLADAVGLEVEKIHYRRDKSGSLSSFYQQDGMHPAGDTSITGYIVELTK